MLVLCALALFSKDLQAQKLPVLQLEPACCDVAYEICRDQVLTLIQNEPANGGEIDLSFWFMTDARYASAITTASRAGVKVRIIMDPRANSKAGNSTQLATFKSAGIPMLNKPFGDIAHWKGMIFKAQKVG